jgi:hypothetical protein
MVVADLFPQCLGSHGELAGELDNNPIDLIFGGHGRELRSKKPTALQWNYF